MKVIKSFARENDGLKRFVDSQTKVVKATIRTVIISASYQPVVFGMRVIGTALILWFGAMFVETGEITIEHW